MRCIVKAKKIIIFSIVAVLLIVGGFVLFGDKSPVEVINNIPENSCYVYAANYYDVVCYNEEDGQVYSYTVEKDSSFQNTFFYSSHEIGNFYSVGDSVEGGFTLIKLNEENYDIIYEENNDDIAFFPIAQNSTQVFLSIEETNGDVVEGGLMLWDEKEGIQKFDNINENEIILCGALGEGCLYYTTYQTDETYSLYEFDYTDSEANANLLCNNLTSPEIFYYNGKVNFFIDGQMEIGEVLLEYTPFIYQYDDWFIVLKSDKYGNTSSVVYDLKTGDIIQENEKMIGYSCDGEKVYTYTENGKKEVKVDE